VVKLVVEAELLGISKNKKAGPEVCYCDYCWHNVMYEIKFIRQKDQDQD
jgi:hypothetical protein